MPGTCSPLPKCRRVRPSRSENDSCSAIVARDARLVQVLQQWNGMLACQSCERLETGHIEHLSTMNTQISVELVQRAGVHKGIIGAHAHQSLGTQQQRNQLAHSLRREAKFLCNITQEWCSQAGLRVHVLDCLQ